MPDSTDWRDLAEKATKETDREKLMQIIEDLCGALRLREEQARKSPGKEPPSKEKSA